MTATEPRTQTDREAAIDELLAKQEIRDALMRYSRGIDLLDPDLVKSAYHPDAYDDHGTFKGNAFEFAEHVMVGLSNLTCTEHFLGNSHIEVDGDRAYSETYHVAYHRIPAGDDGVATDFTWGGRYVDVFERRDGGPWLILHRTVVHSWSRIDPVLDDNATMSANFTQVGRGDRSDLIYRVREVAG